MYIEFNLPTGAAGYAAGHSNMIINNALLEWSNKYGIPYTTKIVKYTKRVTFPKDEHYSLFVMTWNIDKKFYALGRWRLVTDPNNKTKFDVEPE